jgi:hypothetical protein
MKDLFEYFRKRAALNKPLRNDLGENFFGEVHLIFQNGKPIHTRDWQMNDVAMVVESKKI